MCYILEWNNYQTRGTGYHVILKRKPLIMTRRVANSDLWNTTCPETAMQTFAYVELCF